MFATIATRLKRDRRWMQKGDSFPKQKEGIRVTFHLFIASLSSLVKEGKERARGRKKSAGKWMRVRCTPGPPMVLLMWRTIRPRRRRQWPYSSSQPPTNSPPSREWQRASCNQIVVIDDLNPEDSHPSMTRPPLHGYRSTGSDVPCS
ncbi:hypothetical protein B296_00014666 [Ensete ventricosum]|uniref:Uncharacterized protein n=1 Tax=Ensete ventricosum TaxID=4639 RepID=A0A427A9V0_ENSVE|nr:hypothetical protein B296_00014666 [Ensete ventricosum]